MKMKRLIVTTAFVASSAFAAAALAGEADHFTKLDTDGDGMVSSEEATADPILSKDWAEVDLNQDGQLERAEFSAFEQMSKEGKMSKEGEMSKEGMKKHY